LPAAAIGQHAVLFQKSVSNLTGTVSGGGRQNVIVTSKVKILKPTRKQSKKGPG